MASPKPRKFELKFSSDTKYLENVEKLSTKVARYANLSESESDDLGIVTTELVNNAIHHGNKNDPEKQVAPHSGMNLTHLWAGERIMSTSTEIIEMEVVIAG